MKLPIWGHVESHDWLLVFVFVGVLALIALRIVITMGNIYHG